MSSLRRVFVRLQPFLIVLAFAIMGRLLAQQWDGLRAHRWQIRGSWLALSAVLIVSGWLIEIKLWQRTLRLLGGWLRFSDAMRIWFTSLIVRYVPGSVWHPLSITERCQEHEIRPPATLASLVLVQVLHLLAVVTIAAIYVASWGRTSAAAAAYGRGSGVWAVLLAGIVILVLVAPARVLTLLNRVLRKFGRAPVPLELSTATLVKLFGLCLSEWLVLAAGYTALVVGLVIPGTTPLWSIAPHLLAAYPVAWAIGFLSLITPGGLVVREGVLYLLLGPSLGRADALLVALAMRAWEVALEIVISGSIVIRSSIARLAWSRRRRGSHG
jgi:hypothetical protein